MADFFNKDRGKLPASHDTSNYYPPSGEGAQVGGDSMREGHYHYGLGSYAVHGAIGSFGQLLMNANAGMLSQSDPANFWDHSVSKCLHAGTEEDMCEEGDCEEGYQAGTESEQEKTEMGSRANREGAYNECADNHINETYDSISDFVTSFSDTITREEFMFGRGFDHDDFVRGIDDTELNDENVDIQYQDEVPDEDSKSGDDIKNIGADVNLEDGQSEEDGQHELNKASASEGRCCNDNTESEVGGYISPTSSTLGDCGCAKQEIAYEILERYIAQAGVAYKKRYRTLKNTEITDCRKPRDMSAAEIAIRTSSHRKGAHIFEPILGMVFDSKEEAYEFYNMYSWEYGFGIIYNKSINSMQEFCCDKVGKDRRVSRTTKKCNCKAKIKLLCDGHGGWYVSEFVKDHNHPLAESCSEKRNLFSHKRLDPYTLGVIRYLRDSNVSQTKVRCVIGDMFGSFKDAPCTKRSLRTICSQIARERMNDDVGKTMELFKKMKAEDPGFSWSVEVVEGRINTLMWCSGKSREHYACFGDVVTFDTTYSTNFYKMPFGLFVGVNNHFQTIVYAGVLMRNETIESFKWVFKEFVELMGAKPPHTVLTDQCKAMSIALGDVWPDTFHLWCKWHVLKKIRESLGPTYTKNAAFRDEFYSIVNEMMTKQEFEEAWSDLCERYQLTENPFMIRTFQCRSKWAKPWSKGNFCAGMTSTQRSESANWMLKRFVPRNSSMNQFVSQFNKLLDDRDMEEGREEHLTKQLVVNYSRLWPIESHAVKIYTRQSLKLFRKQVDLASKFRVKGKGSDFYLVARSNEDHCPEWRKKVYKVFVYDITAQNGGKYFCECGFFEHIGILCCHTIRLMIMLDKSWIPDSHIVTRWTRSAKDVLPDLMKLTSNKSDISDTECLERRRLHTRALEAVTKGNTDRRTRQIVLKHLDAAIKEANEDLEGRKNQSEIEFFDDEEMSEAADVEATKGNRYGAAGSSAGMSDSDILNLKAPVKDKSRGAPRFKRLKSSAEKNMKKSKKLGVRGQAASTKKSVSKSGTRKKTVKGKTKGTIQSPTSPINRGVPYQSKFCSKCGKPGHNKRNCGNEGEDGSNNVRNDSRIGKERNNRCTKCDLKGHNEQECLVLDEDSGNYFR